ncbi:alcohol dehydrogenase [Exophiala aquamarina CBS 119918]|uniref:Alcohol dehydrogenase n=1 Tax=Exophiala aquamarina CBS 119918 TaxID=1182545 RepID=A0A072NY73_9EURO|nr:alcohol dehydrogenase [Exophiala aquamarina CBS 119918]KEF52799.1 alcohol dehydrogenase [Exophiala aquamarina CBS 119918]
MGDAGLPASLRASVEATKVSYTQLGSSGLRVSIPILGAMSFGHKDWQPWVVDDEEEVDKLLKGAYDRGLNTWDTANVYSNGVSEELIGKTIKKHNLPRHKLVLLSKAYGTVGEEPGVLHIKWGEEMKQSKDYVNQGGLSRTAIFNAVDRSLERLGTTYLDLLQIHRFDKTVPVEETMKALHDLVTSGKVRYIGASSMWAYQFAKMQQVAEKYNWTKFISMQNHYSLAYREEEREMNPYCIETGVGLIPWAPLYRGLLARPLGTKATAREESSKGNPMFSGLTAEDQEIIKRVQELADKKGWKMSHVALVWIIQKKTIPIVGFSNLKRLDEAIGVRGKTLSDDEVKYLEEPYKPKVIVGHS